MTPHPFLRQTLYALAAAGLAGALAPTLGLSDADGATFGVVAGACAFAAASLPRRRRPALPARDTDLRAVYAQRPW